MTEVTDEPELTEKEQLRRRDWFRRHWEHGVAFNRRCGLSVRHWDSDRVELTIPYSDELSANPGILHGGVISSLIDTAGVGAIMAGHDYNRGSRVSTAALSVQYLGVAAGEDLLATAVAIKRGRTMHVASVEVTGRSSARLLATGQVTATIVGERSGLLDPPPNG